MYTIYGFGLATCVPDKRTEKTFSEDKLEIADSISSFVEEEATANKIP